MSGRYRLVKFHTAVVYAVVFVSDLSERGWKRLNLLSDCLLTTSHHTFEYHLYLM